MLKVEHMTLRFGELIANNDVSLEIPGPQGRRADRSKRRRQNDVL